MYYPNKKIYPSYLKNDDRFLVPFLLGGLAGGAVVGLSRPRPIYQMGPSFNPYYPAANYSYSYYVPQYVPNPNLNFY